MNRLVVPAPIARLPWQVIVPLTLLVMFGAPVLYSAAGGSLTPFAGAHLVRFCVFMAMALIISRMPRELVKMAAYPAYAIVLVLLMLVEALGAIGGGSQRWLNLGPLVLQPSELMKPTIVLVLASFYHSLPVGETGSWRSLLPAGVLVAIPVALVLLQPDLGTALAIAFGGAVMMFLAGLPMRWFVGGGLAALILAPLAYFFGLHDYQRRRVTTFLDPERRSVPAESPARGSATARRATSTIFPSRTRISSSPRWRKNGACSAASRFCWCSGSCCAGASASPGARPIGFPLCSQRE